jgi:hypothetical protein
MHKCPKPGTPALAGQLSSPFLLYPANNRATTRHWWHCTMHHTPYTMHHTPYTTCDTREPRTLFVLPPEWLPPTPRRPSDVDGVMCPRTCARARTWPHGSPLPRCPYPRMCWAGALRWGPGGLWCVVGGAWACSVAVALARRVWETLRAALGSPTHCHLTPRQTQAEQAPGIGRA